MEHNSISAMYRQILEALDVQYEYATNPKNHWFWNKQIYAFAHYWENRTLEWVRIALLADALQNLYKLKFQEESTNEPS